MIKIECMSGLDNFFSIQVYIYKSNEAICYNEHNIKKLLMVDLGAFNHTEYNLKVPRQCGQTILRSSRVF